MQNIADQCIIISAKSQQPAEKNAPHAAGLNINPGLWNNTFKEKVLLGNQSLRQACTA